MNELQSMSDHAQKIMLHHNAAHVAANSAISHAKEAGRLLLEVKAALPHGEFTPWIEANLPVTARQAQRYMQAAEGRTPKLKGKSDTVSYLIAPTNDSSFKPLLSIPAGTIVQVTREMQGSWRDDFFVLPSESGEGLFTYAHMSAPVGGGGHVVWSGQPCTEQAVQIAFFMAMHSLKGATVKYTECEAMPDDFWQTTIEGEQQ